MDTDIAQEIAQPAIAPPQRKPVAFPLVNQQANQKQLAFKDLIEGTRQYHLWLMLAYHDIKLRYRRSVIGPFWITLSMAITVYSMGFLYAYLFHIDLAHYYPFLVSGMLSWALVQSIVIDVNDTFTQLEGTIKQIKLPYTLHIHRIVMRNLIIFLHNLVVMLPVMIIFHDTVKVNACTLLLIPGLLAIYLNGIFYGIILAILGARFRDLSQMIKSLMQVVFFLTPVMWNPIILPVDKRTLIYLNPFYSYLELIRAPLLGHMPAWPTVAITAGLSMIGIGISMCLFVRYRSRIIYWL